MLSKIILVYNRKFKRTNKIIKIDFIIKTTFLKNSTWVEFSQIISVYTRKFKQTKENDIRYFPILNVIKAKKPIPTTKYYCFDHHCLATRIPILITIYVLRHFGQQKIYKAAATEDTSRTEHGKTPQNNKKIQTDLTQTQTNKTWTGKTKKK